MLSLTEQEFYEYIAKNYVSIHKFCNKYIKEMSRAEWDKENKCWFPEIDEWNAYDTHVDINFWSDGNGINYPWSAESESEHPTSRKPVMHATAYHYSTGGVITETYVKICETEGKSV